MFIHKLFLSHFRCYESKVVEFDNSLTSIVGPNGIGKTAILEAIALAIHGRSFRSDKLSELVRKGQNGFAVQIQFSNQAVSQTIEIRQSAEGKAVWINGNRCRSWANLLGSLCGVSMTPGDIEIVRGVPLYRRRYLDAQLAQTDPLFVFHSRRMVQAVKQRSALLKAGQPQLLQPWDHLLATSSAYVTFRRLQLLEDLKEHLDEVGQTFHLNSRLGVSYHSQCFDEGASAGQQELAQLILEQIQAKRTQEVRRGHTLVGAHRDDVRLTLDGHPISQYASEGQSRLVATILRLSEWRRMRDQLDGNPPVLLADDVGMGLDSGRRHILTGVLDSLGQVITTGTEPLYAPSEI